MRNRKNSGVCEKNTSSKNREGPQEEKDALLKAHFCSYVQKNDYFNRIAAEKKPAQKNAPKKIYHSM